MKGLKAVDRRNKIVMIHDSARPCVTNRMILDSISGARRYKACTVAMPVKDTIKIVDEMNSEWRLRTEAEYIRFRRLRPLRRVFWKRRIRDLRSAVTGM